MSERFADVTCLECGASYTVEADHEHVEECRDCGSNETEWRGFKV